MSSEGNEIHGRKRQRTQNACDECRRKKVRCDSAVNLSSKCSNCIQGHIECTHELEKRKRGPRAGLRRSTKKNESVRSLVNAILSTSNPFAIPENLEDVRKMLVDLANFARSLDRRLAETRSDPPTREDSDYEVVLNASLEGKQQGIQDSIDSITEDFQKVMIDIDSAHRHFGKSSNWIWVQSALDFRRDELGARSLTGAAWAKYHRPWMWKAAPWQKKTEMLALPDLVFPDGGLLAELIGLYFDNINQFSPLLHRPTFEGAVMDQLHLQDRSFGLLVLSVCALGSRHSSDPRNLCSGRYAEFSQGWKWFCQIPLIRPSLTEPPTLYDLQICILSAFYLQTTALNEAAWTTIGFGIRCVHEIGVHRRKPGHRKHTIEDELWKRAFWILVSTDLILSLFQGRPRATTPDDFDIDLPAECDDEYWESVGSGKPFVQPRGKPSTTSYFVTLLKLLDILSLVERTLYTARRTDLWVSISGLDWKREAVSKLDSALRNFLDEIPVHLKWQPHRKECTVFYQQSALLHMVYHWVQILIHRPFIPRLREAPMLPFPSLSICSNAARSLFQILEILHPQNDQLSRLPPLSLIPNVITPLLSSSFMLLLALWREKDTILASEYQRDMGYVHKCLDVFKHYEPKYQMAGRVFDVLNTVIRVGQPSMQPTSIHVTETWSREFYPSDQQIGDPTNSGYADYPASAALGVPLMDMSIYALQQTHPASTLELDMVMPSHLDPSIHTTAPLLIGSGFDYTQSGSSVSNPEPFLQHDEVFEPAASIIGGDLWPTDWNTFLASIDDFMSSAHRQLH